MEKLTKEIFIKKAKQVHNNKYDYSLVEYINNRTKVKIICPIHGVFEQIPMSHLKGYGCSECKKDTLRKLNQKTTEKFIKKAKEVHDDKYDYSLVEYVNNKTKIKIICPEHGVFEQTPYHHIQGSGCPKCYGLNKTTEEFIEKARQIHGNKYDYSLAEYINNNTKVKIICPIHGIFEQTPTNHTHKTLKQGCPKCSSNSKGEESISKILTENNIIFERQKKFNDCFNINKLPFDFFLPAHNTCIEFQGRQHYSNKSWGGEESLRKIQITDKIKKDYCAKNGIKLLEIKYNENIKDILQNFF